MSIDSRRLLRDTTRPRRAGKDVCRRKLLKLLSNLRVARPSAKTAVSTDAIWADPIQLLTFCRRLPLPLLVSGAAGYNAPVVRCNKIPAEVSSDAVSNHFLIVSNRRQTVINAHRRYRTKTSQRHRKHNTSLLIYCLHEYVFLERR